MGNLEVLLDGLNGYHMVTLGRKNLDHFKVSGLVSHPEQTVTDLKDFWTSSVGTCESANSRFDPEQLYNREKMFGTNYRHSVFVDSYHSNVSLTRKVDRTINAIVVNVQRNNSFLYHEGFKLPVTIASGEISVHKTHTLHAVLDWLFVNETCEH